MIASAIVLGTIGYIIGFAVAGMSGGVIAGLIGASIAAMAED